MSVTMGQIAKKAGVSQATVSRVLSGRSVGFISDATRQKVREVAAELGFKHAAAGGDAADERQVRGRSGVISIWASWPTDGWATRLLGAIIERAWEEGYEGHIRPLVVDEEDQRRTAFAWPVDGIIAIGRGGLDALTTHRRTARPGRKPKGNGGGKGPVSVLTVRGRAVPVVVIGVEAGCKGVECPAEFDAVRCNPDEGCSQGDCRADLIANAAWAQLRKRIIGGSGQASAVSGGTRSVTGGAGGVGVTGGTGDQRGVHIWVSADGTPEPAEPGGKKHAAVRLYPVVEREPRLQSADVKLV